MGKRVIRVLSVVVLSILGTLLIVSWLLAKRDLIHYPSNLMVGNIPLSGSMRAEGIELLRSNYELNHLVCIFPWGNKTFSLAETGASFDIQATLLAVDNVLSGSWLGLEPIKLRGIIKSITPVYSWPDELMNQFVTQLKERYDKSPSDAAMILDKGRLTGVPEEVGYSLDYNATLKEIKASLQTGFMQPAKVCMVEIEPQVKLDQIRGINDLLGVGAAYISDDFGSFERAVNYLNGQIVMEGESLAVGDIFDRLQPQIAPAIVDKIRDITVSAWKQPNLGTSGTPPRLLNDSGYPVMIAAIIEGQVLLVKIYGVQPIDGREISIVQETETLKNTLSKLDKVLRIYKIVKINGQETEKTLLLEEPVKGQPTTGLPVSVNQFK
ncbi:MAG: hypothetical protein GX550_05240 [Syntrophomonadaceae bacterium]|nr:hypothetical protein [Syntrophomonadaceae bacterium]